MVLAAALYQSRATDGVFLFAPFFPEYDCRMEVISLITRMWMEWDCGMELAPRD